MSDKMKNRKPWNKGKQTSNEVKNKQSNSRKKYYANGGKPWNINEKKQDWLQKFTEKTGKSYSSFRRFWKEMKNFETFEEAFSLY